MIKRVVDLVLAGAGLLVVLPLLVVIAVLVKLDSPGPALFRQIRVGRHGVPFRILKFRTMVANAPALGPRLTQKRDPRVTRVGEILRWLKLDELPQLANVVRGEMSLVGPRPEDPHFVATYTPEQRRVLSVRPGIVGPSQILGHDESAAYPDDVEDTEAYYLRHILPGKLATDLAYLEHCHFWGDLRLVAAGVGVTVAGAFKRRFFAQHRERVALLAFDAVAGVGTYVLAYGVTVDWRLDAPAPSAVALVGGLAALLRPLTYLYFGLYGSVLRHLGTPEFLVIAKSVAIGSVMVTAAASLVGLGIRPALVLVDAGLLILCLYGGRVVVKSWGEDRREAPAAAMHANGHATPPALAAATAAPAARNGRAPRETAEARPILVTGGAGYVGAHVVRKLLAQGRRVRVLDRFLYGTHGLDPSVARHRRLEIVDGDIRHLDTLARAAKGVDRVIALAALVGDAACDLDPEETECVNLEATRLLAVVCARANVRRVVFASSCSVYGANSQLTLNEGSWLNPVSLYARTRIRSEAMLLRRPADLGVVILRLATVFGLSARMRLDLLVNTFTAHAYFTGRVRVFGGEQWRPNLHVQDAADAFIAAADAPDDVVRGEIFNVGDNAANHTVRDVAAIVRGVLPRAQVEILAAAPDQRDYRVSFDKIQHVLGFRPRFTVEDGAREMARAFAAGEVKEPDHARYYNLRALQTRAATDNGVAQPAAIGA